MSDSAIFTFGFLVFGLSLAATMVLTIGTSGVAAGAGNEHNETESPPGPLESRDGAQLHGAARRLASRNGT